MVALDEQQFQCHQAVVRERVGVGDDRHAASGGRGAGGQQAVDALDLDQAQAARSRRAQAFQKAQRWDRTPACRGHLENGLAFRRRAQLAVDANRDLLRHSIAPIDAPQCARPFHGCRSAGNGQLPRAPRRHATPRPLPRTTGRACAQAGNARDGGRTGLSSGGVWSYANVGNICSNRASPVRCWSMLRAASLPDAIAVTTFDAPAT